MLIKHDIPIHPNLPLIDLGKPRTSKEVCERIIALYALAGLANGAAGYLLKDWLIDEGGLGFLSTHEQQLLNNYDGLNPEEINELSWKQESLYVLCWSGSLVDKVVWPTKEADLNNVFGLIPPETSFAKFFTSFNLRSFEEIAKQLDVYYCLHAAMRHPEIWIDNTQSRSLKMEAILERRQALEWVLSPSTDWDEISLDT